MPRTKRQSSPYPQRRPFVVIDTSQKPHVESFDVAQIPSLEIGAPLPHPNLYRRRFRRPPDGLQPGQLVGVHTPDGRTLGFGLYNSASEIAVRMLTWGESPPDAALWDERLTTAIDLRDGMLKLGDDTNACRLIHAEGDLLPGFVADRYADVVSIEVFSLGMFQRAESLARRLADLCGARHWLVRTSPHSETQEGFDAAPLRSESLPQSVTIQEFGTRFRVRFEGGHKTGFFCDQRDNRRRLAGYCEGRSVLDLCCYTGGFAVQAKTLGRASDVTGVEIDTEPLKLAKENANLNQARINFVNADAFAYMRDMLKNGRQYDVVVLDPPKLIRNRSEIEDGTRLHFDFNRLAMRLVKPGGLLLTCSCAGLLAYDEFNKLLASAARQAGPPEAGSINPERPRHLPRQMQIIDRTGAGGDHPVSGNCPESDYLKAVWVRML
ncbi:MAG: class I SAM-dependent rRNA methyltransferase [Planctomycetaceae bacterium]